MTVLANLINGEWVTTQENRPNVNPANTNDIIGYSPISTSEHVEQAIAAANAAFPAWSTSPIQQRSTILDKAGTEILERKEELGRLLAREEGKTLAEAIGEVVRAGDVFKFMSCCFQKRGETQAARFELCADNSNNIVHGDGTVSKAPLY